MEFPELVAVEWFARLHTNVPMKCWEKGYGVVVGKSPNGNPLFVIKGMGPFGGEYSLWEYDIKE